ncbi:MAG TPA: hypothetical protein PLV92_04355, partial [Pirellulaceae bacterium]|nr:hypothetical protein [Pirellulaceae bacterium]
VDGGIGYGVPPKGPTGETPNAFAPLTVGRLPRGVAVQPASTGDIVSLQPTPYNVQPSFEAFPNEPLQLPAGVQSTVEAQTGALREHHDLVSYQANGATRQWTLTYDSLSADPRPIYYFDAANLDQLKSMKSDTRRMVVRLSAKLGDKSFDLPGLDPAQATSLGLLGNENFFQLPTTMSKDESYGAGLQIDLSDGQSGVYTFTLDYGVEELRNGEYSGGRMVTQKAPVGVLNATKSAFGAGWGLAGQFEIFPGDGGVLLADGTGRMQIFLAPANYGDPFTPLVRDNSVLRQEPDGRFTWTKIDGTVFRFDHFNKLETITDRNNNITTFVYEPTSGGSERLVAIRDFGPGGQSNPALTTTFSYSGGSGGAGGGGAGGGAGDRVRVITDPAGRRTLLDYDANGNLTRITDPDGTFRTFDYGEASKDQEHLLVKQTHKRGNDPHDPLYQNDFETIRYDDATHRVTGGMRVDKKEFTLTPSQQFAAADLTKSADPKTAPTLFTLSRKGLTDPPTDAAIIAQNAVNGTPRSTEATKYLSQATYVDFRGISDTYGLGPQGNFQKLNDPKQPGISYAQSLDGAKLATVRPVSLADGLYTRVVTTFDLYQNVLAVTDYPDGPNSTRGATKTYHYDTSKFYRLDRSVDEIGRVTENVLDAFGNILSTTITDPQAPAFEPHSTTTQFTYYVGGQLHTSLDPNGNTTTYVYDTYGRLTDVQYVDGTEHYEYDDLTGNVSVFVDANDNRTEYEYDLMNRLTETRTFVLDEHGSRVVYTVHTDYDSAGNPTSSKDRNNVWTDFTFDALQRPLTKVEARGTSTEYVTHFGYEAASNPAAYKDVIPVDKTYSYRWVQLPRAIDENNPSGFVTTEVYDKDNLLIRAYDTLGRMTKNTYDDANQLIRSENTATGGVTTMTRDGRGRITKLTGPTVEVVRTRWDDVNRASQVRVENDGRDQVTEVLAFSLFDQPALSRDAEGHLKKFEHDAAGNLVRQTDAADSSQPFVTEYFYEDGRNRITKAIAGGTAVTRYEYLPGGQLKMVTDALGHSTTYAYDGMNRQIETVDAEGFKTETLYDGVGNVVATIDPRGLGDRASTTYRTTYVYDPHNRLWQTIDPLGNTTVYRYDAAGNRIDVIDARSGFHPHDPDEDTGAAYKTHSVYDRANRLIEVHYPAGPNDLADNITVYRYDETDHVSLMVDGRAGGYAGTGTYSTEYHHDASGRLRWSKQWVAAGEFQTTTYKYDQVGNVLDLVDYRGVESSTRYSYDKLNRVVTETHAPDTAEQSAKTTEYHPLGMVAATVLDAPLDAIHDRTEYLYDALQHLQSVKVAAQSGLLSAETKYVYDAVGNLKSVTDPRGDFYTTHYTYYDNNRRKTASGPTGTPTQSTDYVVTYQYDEAGHLKSATDPRNADWKTRYTYDAAGRTTTVTNAQDETTTYTYDAVGNRIAEVDPRGGGDPDNAEFSTSYGFDGLNRVISVTTPPHTTTEIDGARGGATTWSIYDAVGNLVKSVGARAAVESWSAARSATEYVTTSEFDGVNRRTAAVDSENNRTEWKYAVDGSSTTIVDPRSFDARYGGQFTTKYEYDRLGHLKRETTSAGLHGNDEPPIVRDMHYDALGNLRTEEDGRGSQFTTTYKYDPQFRVIEVDVPGGTAEAPLPPLVTQFGYDLAGNRTSVTDPRGSYYTTTFEFNAHNLVVGKTVPTGSEAHPGLPSTWRYEFDAAGNMVSELDPRGPYYTTTYVYDAAGRLSDKYVPLGDPDQNPQAPGHWHYGYDLAGNLTLQVSPRVDAVTAQHFEQRWTFNAENQVIESTDANHQIT